MIPLIFLLQITALCIITHIMFRYLSKKILRISNKKLSVIPIISHISYRQFISTISHLLENWYINVTVHHFPNYLNIIWYCNSLRQGTDVPIPNCIGKWKQLCIRRLHALNNMAKHEAVYHGVEQLHIFEMNCK